MKLNYVGVDLAKNVFQLHGVDRSGKAVISPPEGLRADVDPQLAFS